MQQHRRTLEDGARRDIDDLAVAVLLHFRYGRLGAAEHAPRIDLHHAVPFGFVDIKERALFKVGKQRRIIDQDIEPPICVHRFGNHGPDIFRIRHIAVNADGLATRLLDDVHGRLCIDDVCNGHLRPLGRQNFRIFDADTASATGYDGYLSVKSSHFILRSFVRGLSRIIPSLGTCSKTRDHSRARLSPRPLPSVRSRSHRHVRQSRAPGECSVRPIAW